jgi:cytochrome c peroxidase
MRERDRNDGEDFFAVLTKLRVKERSANPFGRRIARFERRFATPGLNIDRYDEGDESNLLTSL